LVRPADAAAAEVAVEQGGEAHRDTWRDLAARRCLVEERGKLLELLVAGLPLELQPAPRARLRRLQPEVIGELNRVRIGDLHTVRGIRHVESGRLAHPRCFGEQAGPAERGAAGALQGGAYADICVRVGEQRPAPKVGQLDLRRRLDRARRAWSTANACLVCLRLEQRTLEVFDRLTALPLAHALVLAGRAIDAAREAGAEPSKTVFDRDEVETARHGQLRRFAKYVPAALMRAPPMSPMSDIRPALRW